MAISQEFMSAVAEQRATRVRIMLKNCMLVDRTLVTFEERLAYAQQHMVDLFVAHDGEELRAADWTPSYLDEQMVKVIDNFSQERVDLLRKMIKHLYPQPVAAPVAEPKQGCVCKRMTPLQWTGAGIAVVGTGVLVLGIAGESYVLAAAMGVAIAGGVALIALGGRGSADNER